VGKGAEQLARRQPIIDARVALVHERLTEIGGSERVVEQLARLCPNSSLFVPIADPTLRLNGLSDISIQTSGLQRLYAGGEHYAHLLPLLPMAMCNADLGQPDVVVTSHHAFANRVRVPSGVPVVSYTHTPARWMWQAAMRAGEGTLVSRSALAAFSATQRAADRRAAARAHTIISNSRAVAHRVSLWWGRQAVVVPPPVDVVGFHPDPFVERENFFLLAGRMVPYKQPQVAVEAARRAGVRLVVVGDGRMRAECERVAGPRTEFLGRVDDATLLDLYRRCRALIFPGHEDFGIVPVEAQACGAPVIALGVGGVLDTVVPGVTGQLIDPRGEVVGNLAAAMIAFDPRSYSPFVIRRHAERFSEYAFHSRMASVLSDVLVATTRGRDERTIHLDGGDIQDTAAVGA
jgi:glycosyltransferase involved in cell wall biosynthesis